jgi:hypothetical protein
MELVAAHPQRILPIGSRHARSPRRIVSLRIIAATFMQRQPGHCRHRDLTVRAGAVPIA